MTHTNPLLLSDEELEECIDGCTSLDLLREILRQPPVVGRFNRVDIKQFANYFQMALEDLAEDDEASENNYQWGLSIADSINDKTLLSTPKTSVGNPQDAWPKP
jgi:hypothetical protein